MARPRGLRGLDGLHGRHRGGVPDPRSAHALARSALHGAARAAAGRPGARRPVAGELIASEIEIRSGRARPSPTRSRSQREARPRLFRSRPTTAARLGATGTHPWTPGRSSRSSTPRTTSGFRRARLRALAQQHFCCTCTWASAEPTRDRVCDRLRAVLPELLPSLPTRRSSTPPTRAALRPHSDLHEELSALRHPRTFGDGPAAPTTSSS